MAKIKLLNLGQATINLVTTYIYSTSGAAIGFNCGPAVGSVIRFQITGYDNAETRLAALLYHNKALGTDWTLKDEQFDSSLRSSSTLAS